MRHESEGCRLDVDRIGFEKTSISKANLFNIIDVLSMAIATLSQKKDFQIASDIN